MSLFPHAKGKRASITIFAQWMDFYPFDYTMFFSLAGIAGFLGRQR
jgi:hypothetical protein